MENPTTNTPQQIVETARKEFASLANRIFIENNKRIDTAISVIESKVKDLKQEVINQISELEDMVESSQITAANLAKEREHLEAERKELTAERERYEKALSALKLAGSIEMEQYAAEAALTNRRNRLNEERKIEDKRLDDELAALSDNFDARREALQAARAQYYPELEAELQRITEEYAGEPQTPQAKKVDKAKKEAGVKPLQKPAPEISLPELKDLG